jgi:hypothetical protein
MFVLSPRGNGLDCYRTWEALLIGTIPICLRSTLDPLYDGLPVLLVASWDDVTQELLLKKYKEFTNNKDMYNHERMFAQYWIDTIKDVQQNFLKSYAGTELE